MSRNYLEQGLCCHTNVVWSKEVDRGGGDGEEESYEVREICNEAFISRTLCL